MNEIHDVAYDTLSNIIFGGSQDNGTNEQITTGGTTWRTASGGDGGDVAVDNSSGTQSIRYQSFQFLGAFRRRVYNASNVLQSETFPALNVTSGPALAPQFLTPVELNKIDPTRLVIEGNNSVYESLDQGANIAEVPPGGTGPNTTDGFGLLQNAVAYGGKSASIPNEDVLYVGVNDKIRVRTTAGGNLNIASAYPGSFVRDIVLDPNEWMRAFVVDDTGHVWQTNDTGSSWTDITGNLIGIGAQDFHTLAFVPTSPNDLLVLGTQTGVYVSASNGFASWDHLGTGLPNTLVFDLGYDTGDDLLVAGTLGRGAWTLTGVSGVTVTTSTATTSSTTTTLPDDTGFVPPDAATGKCEDGVAKALSKYVKTGIKCHLKSADSGVKGVPLDDELCESDPSTGKGAEERFDAAITKLSGKGCGGCAIGNAFALRAAAEMFLGDNNGQIYCAGSTAFEGGDDTGFVPPDTATGKCEDRVAKALSKYMTKVIKCHIKTADLGVKALPHDDELCESNPSTGKGAKEKFDAAVAKLSGVGCGGCAIANAPALRAAADAFLDGNNGQVYCAGSEPF